MPAPAPLPPPPLPPEPEPRPFPLLALGLLAPVLALLLWQLPAAVLAELREARSRAPMGRGFAFTASEEQRFLRLGTAGRAFLLVSRHTPRRADIYLHTAPGLEGAALHVQLAHLLYPRATHHLVAPPPDAEFVDSHLPKGGWVLDAGSGSGFDWASAARFVAQDEELKLLQIPSGGRR